MAEDYQGLTPPPELVQQWLACAPDPLYRLEHVATQAARWGADQELEACINYFHKYDTSWGEDSELIEGLRTARRPKPPSLAEEARDALDRLRKEAWCEEVAYDLDAVRRAVERLQELESNG